MSQALEHNRLVKDAVLDAEKSVFRVNVARSRRLPQFQIAVLAGQLLRPIDFTFPAGSFGTYADGPVPSTDSKITTPSQLTTFVTGSVDLPLLQQHEIGLDIRATELAGEIAREGVRHRRQKIAADVRTAYFSLVATQAAVDAARETVRTLEEAQRVTTQYRLQEVVLRAEGLEVDARLARSHYDLSAAENGLATQREQLNQLLGRELTTEFRVHAIQEDTPAASRSVRPGSARSTAGPKSGRPSSSRNRPTTSAGSRRPTTCLISACRRGISASTTTR